MDNEMMKARNLFVVKANALIQRSRFSLSLQQQKIVLYLISKIKPTDTEFTLYEFNIQDFCHVCGIDYSNGKNYLDLKRQIKEIADKSLWVTLEGGTDTLLRWIERPYINKREGIIRIKLDEYMKPFLLELKAQYTQYQLKYTLRMQSKYSLRLYEVAMSYFYRKTDSYSRYFNVEELRKLLDAESYSKFGEFHTRVLKPAVREINLYTDLNLIYKQIKKGRKTVAIEFTFSSKSALDRILLDDEIDEDLSNKSKEN